MNKNIIILLYTLFTFNLLVGDNSASMDISFLDLPTTSRTASLGSTFLSDIGSPSNLLLNPSNIWFGDRVNSNKKFFKNLFLRSNITNYEIIGNNYYNVFGSIQFGNGITFGSGYIGIGQSDLNHYDSNANYLGEIKHTQNAYIFGSATRLLGINIGVSGAYIQTDFSNIGNFGNQDDIIVASIGLSMNNKSINIDRSEIWKQILIPSKISLHVLSRNVISDISSNINISNNSLFKNIIGFRFDNDIEFFEQYDYRKRRRQVASFYLDNLPYTCVPGDNFIWERYTMNVPHKEVEKVRPESVVSVIGEVVNRSPETINQDIFTGEVEIKIFDQSSNNLLMDLSGNLRIDTAKEFDYIEQGNILNYVLKELSN